MKGKKQTKAAKLFNEGNRLSDHGEFEAALERYEAAVAADPKFQDPYIAIAYLKHRLGDVEGAERTLRRALALGDHPVVLYNLGWILNERAEYAEAAACLERSVEIADDFLMAWKELGAARLRLARYDDAELAFQRALAIDSDDVDSRLGLHRLPRFREFPEPFPGGAPGMKEEVYLRYGAVCLGVDTDDGASVPNYFFHNFDGALAVATTLARFLEHREVWGWHFDRLAILDAESEPLAIALSAALRVPIGTDPPKRGESVLLVGAVVRDVEPYRSAVRPFRAAGARPFVFLLGLDSNVDLIEDEEPQVVGVLTRISVFWNKSEEFSRWKVVKDAKTGEETVVTEPPEIDERPSDVIGREIFEALRTLVPAEAIAGDGDAIRGYYEKDHPQLNFEPRTVGRKRQR
ncbi:MAG: tetratricopeptide repeat protein [Planctomycetes bacterium]|nr:tetratricopeptide repeat protein [Planctomycetota bacterium]MBI3846435.1 tetratricopeptide repeat protein [Planctomycetota bacterium]